MRGDATGAFRSVKGRRGDPRPPSAARVPDALSTVPLVILSRIRRTADPQVLLIQAFALYASFLMAAWFKNVSLLQARWGLLRLAIPSGMALLGLILEQTALIAAMIAVALCVVVAYQIWKR